MVTLQLGCTQCYCWVCLMRVLSTNEKGDGLTTAPQSPNTLFIEALLWLAGKTAVLTQHAAVTSTAREDLHPHSLNKVEFYTHLHTRNSTTQYRIVQKRQHVRHTCKETVSLCSQIEHQEPQTSQHGAIHTHRLVESEEDNHG